MSEADQGRIETDRLLLRPFEVADAPVVQRELSRVEMARMLAIPYPYPEDGATKWIVTARPGRDFAIVLRETNDVIGGIGLYEREQHRRAELGYWCAMDTGGAGTQPRRCAQSSITASVCWPSTGCMPSATATIRRPGAFSKKPG